MEHVDENVADLDSVAILDAFDLRLVGKGVLPGSVSLVGDVQGPAGARGQLPAPRKIVGVYVRFSDVRDPRALRFGRLDVLIRVAIGVDDDALTLFGATNHVARLRQF